VLGVEFERLKTWTRPVTRSAMKRKVREVTMSSGSSSLGFPSTPPALEKFGLKFSSGGAHISRTMLAELGEVFTEVPQSSAAADYRGAILQRNVGKTTESTRQKSLRHLKRSLSSVSDPRSTRTKFCRMSSALGCSRSPRSPSTPAFKVRGQWRFKRIDIDRWIDQQKTVSRDEGRG